MQFLKCTQVALLLSSAIFAATTAPLVKLADERVNVEFNRVQVFSGPIRDFSSAYLAAAALLSLSLGTAGFSLAAWRQTGTNLKQTKKTVVELETLVSQREQQLQLAQLSTGRLQQSGLNHFLEDDFQLPASVSPAVNQLPQAQSVPVHSSVVSQVVLPPAERAQPMTWPTAPRSVPSHAQPSSHSQPIQAQPAQAVSQGQLSAAQMAQLQAVQFQLDQLSHLQNSDSQGGNSPTPIQQHNQLPRGYAQGDRSQPGGQAEASQRPQQRGQSERPAGFLVINPYQVQSLPQPNQRAVQPLRHLA